MTEVIEKSIFLTFDEIRILLYGMGVSQIDGVYMKEKRFNENEIVSAMHHMAATGFIKAEEDKFKVREDVRRTLQIMAAPERTDIWRPHGEEGPAFFLYYQKDQIVVSERFWRKKDTLKLSVFEQHVFEKWREEWLDDNRGD